MSDLLKLKSPDVWSIPPKAMVFDALRLMGDKEVGALMVIDVDGTVMGIISERDYARKIVLKGRQSNLTLVEEIMTPVSKMHRVSPSNTVEECMVLMTANHVRHLPVYQDDKFVGLISIGDVVMAVIQDRESLIEHLNDYIQGKYV